jgi:hypothetical protein
MLNIFRLTLAHQIAQVHTGVVRRLTRRLADVDGTALYHEARWYGYGLSIRHSMVENHRGRLCMAVSRRGGFIFQCKVPVSG